MKLLSFFLAAGALGFYVFVSPSQRNIAILKRTIGVCVALLMGVWVWPDEVGAIAAALLLALALWLAGRFLLWPVHYLACLLRR